MAIGAEDNPLYLGLPYEGHSLYLSCSCFSFAQSRPWTTLGTQIQLGGLRHPGLSDLPRVTPERLTGLFCHLTCEVCDPTDMELISLSLVYFSFAEG